MELLKSETSQHGNQINKFNLKYDVDKDKWLNLIELLYKSMDNNAVIIKGLYDKKKDIVLKVGYQSAINKEYDIAEILKELPSFITYYCKFMCNDDIMNIINNRHMLINYKMCNDGYKPIGILIMNYYNLGSIGYYKWNMENFLILKNVLKQTVFAILYAYEKKGFIHGDLHIGNVLLKLKVKNEIYYDKKKLLVNTFEVRIMDFEKSKINIKNDFMTVIKNIQKLLDSLCIYGNLAINIGYDQLKLRALLKDEFKEIHYKILNEIIDGIVVD
jgi:hypothetical protein